MTKMPAEAGWQVAAAGSGNTAIALPEEGPFDLLVTAVDMPVQLEGYEPARYALAQLAGLPVVVITDWPEP